MFLTETVADTRYQKLGTSTQPSVKDFGAVGNGSTDDTAAFAAALAAHQAIYVPPGTYVAQIQAVDGRHIQGAGRDVTTIRARAGDSQIILGASADTVSKFTLDGLAVDGNFSNVAAAVAGVQITNGNKITIRNCRFTNLGGVGVLLQGLGSGGGTPNSEVSDNDFDGCGLSNGTTGFGVLIKDASLCCRVIGNGLRNVVGGMGVGGSGSGGTGFPLHMAIVGNTIEMASSTTGFEAIGLTAGCDYATIADNVIVDSWDNGISYSAARGTITGNVVDGARNHGIAVVGAGTAIVGNMIRNVGKQADALYGGVSITTGGRCLVQGNTIVDDQGSPTMAYGVKLTTSSGNNLIALNTISGHTQASAFNGIVTGDLLIDATTRTNGFQIPRIYLDDIQPATSGQAMTATGDLRATSRFWVGSPGTGGGQLNVATNAGSTRPSLDVNRVGSQSVALQRWMHDNLSTVLAQVTSTGRVESSDGVTTKDVGDVTGLSSAQIDALFAATPANGTVAAGLRSAVPVMLCRRNGSWAFANLTAIA